MKDIIVVLDNIRSGYNVGSILRTSEFLGIKNIIGLGITPLPPHKEVTKTSLGAEKKLIVERHFRFKDLVKKLKKERYIIVAIEQSKSSIPYYKFKKKNKKLALVLGNELRGIDKKHLKLCDCILEIPKIGEIKESLNVSIAFSIVLSYLVFEL